ncbi:hypothetical protein [Rhizobium sp. LjRoot258]|jgi:hypothetical protein
MFEDRETEPRQITIFSFRVPIAARKSPEEESGLIEGYYQV